MEDIKEEEKKINKIVIDGKEQNVINSVTVIEIIAHKLEDGSEIRQVIAQEFMMIKHKAYMVKVLTDAINTVMRAVARTPKIDLTRNIPRINDIFRRR